MRPDTAQIKNIIQQALTEDIGSGDVTSNCTIAPDKILEGHWIAKEDGIMAGLEPLRQTFQLLDSNVIFSFHIEDGGSVEPGTEIGSVKGLGRALLSGERVVLNLMQRMSGIATATNKLVKSVKGTQAVILDTRKTAPGLRFFDKWAVQLGGGQNHRFGLFDMVLIKENHITAAGSITDAVNHVRLKDKQHREIEVEVKNIAELQETLALNVDRILLDNMSPKQMRQAVQMSAGRIPLEASGNVTIETIKDIAETGVNYISVGAITHSVKALDISFLVK